MKLNKTDYKLERKVTISKTICLVLVFGFAQEAYASSMASGTASLAASSAPSPTPVAKRVLELGQVEHVKISLPDETTHDFGPDFRARLTTFLTNSGKYVVMEPESTHKAQQQSSGLQGSETYQWEGGAVPAAKVSISVDALSFQTGSGGGRMFYGFNERMRSHFNDGTGSNTNEFPVQATSLDNQEPVQSAWFGNFFNKKGSFPTDSQSGLDLGDGFKINLLYAWLTVKYATYHSQLHLRVAVNAPLSGVNNYRNVHIDGSGYFYDVVGAYSQWGAGLMIARRDAMLQAFDNAVQGAMDSIAVSVKDLPLTAVIDSISPAGVYFLGTGLDANIAPGTRYELVGQPGVIFEVTASYRSGSLAKLIQVQPASALSQAIAGATLVQSQENPRLVSQLQDSISPGLVTNENITLPATNLNPSDLTGKVSQKTLLQAFLQGLLETVLLPYKIWRYYQYDQAYHAEADSDSEFNSGTNPSDNEASSTPVPDFYAGVEKQGWAKNIGLQAATRNAAFSGTKPIVAVIDSGVDYNHPAIHNALWLNPTPTKDPSGLQDRYGWDFISGDSRPFDDDYHGTEVASAVLAIAPHTQIMPLKVFNPWGITNSASIYAAFVYAVDHGANVILCAWATRRDSQAIRQGVAYAEEHGVPVVAAAGDLGVSLKLINYYPAILSEKFANVIAVAAIDNNNSLLSLSNYDSNSINIAAPGQNVIVADPRNHSDTVSSTGISAAFVAGTISSAIAEGKLSVGSLDRQTILNAISTQVSSLNDKVQGGSKLSL